MLLRAYDYVCDCDEYLSLGRWPKSKYIQVIELQIYKTKLCVMYRTHNGDTPNGHCWLELADLPLARAAARERKRPVRYGIYEIQPVARERYKLLARALWASEHAHVMLAREVLLHAQLQDLLWLVVRWFTLFMRGRVRADTQSRKKYEPRLYALYMLTREFSFIGTFWMRDNVLARPRIVFSNCDYGNDNTFYARMSRFQLDWYCITVINYHSPEHCGDSKTYALED